MEKKQKKISLESLAASQRQFIEKKRISQTATIVKWLSFLRGIADFDRQVNKERKSGNGFALSAAIIFIILFFVSMIAGYPLFGVGFLIVGIMLGVYIWIVSRRLRKVDLSDQMIDFVIPFLQIIQDDLHPKSTIQLTMDMEILILRLPDRKEKSKGFGYPKIKTEFFEIPWFSLRVTLVDKTKLYISISDSVRRLTITKRTSRGKIKTKTKIKGCRCIAAHVSVDNERYQVAATPSNAAKPRNAPGNTLPKTSVTSKEMSSTIRVQLNDKFNEYKAVDTTKVLSLIVSALSLLEKNKAEQAS